MAWLDLQVGILELFAERAQQPDDMLEVLRAESIERSRVQALEYYYRAGRGAQLKARRLTRPPCPVCGSAVAARHGRAKHCSDRCRFAARRQRERAA